MKQYLIIILSCFIFAISFHAQAQFEKDTGTEIAKTKTEKKKLKRNKPQRIDTGKKSAFNLESIKQQISETNKVFSAALVNGDSAAIANIFHSETIIYPANLPSMNSGSEMGQIAILLPAMGIKSMEIKSIDIFGYDDMVVETGTYSLRNSKQPIDAGRYIVVWKKEGEKWKIYRDIWNSDGSIEKE